MIIQVEYAENKCHSIVVQIDILLKMFDFRCYSSKKRIKIKKQ